MFGDVIRGGRRNRCSVRIARLKVVFLPASDVPIVRRLNQSLRGYWENSDAEIGKNLRNQVENSMFVWVAMTVVMVGGG